MKYPFSLFMVLAGLMVSLLNGHAMGSKNSSSSTASSQVFSVANSPELLSSLDPETLPCSITFQEALTSVRRGREPLLPPKDTCPIQNKTIEWLWFQQSCPNPRAAIDFIQKNPHWPDSAKIRAQIEKALPGTLSPREVVTYFETFPPTTSEGALANAWAIERIYRIPTRYEKLAVLWKNTNFTEPDERLFYQKYGRFLTSSDHCNRLNRLMIEGNYYGLMSMKKYVSKNAQKTIMYVVHLIQRKSKIRMRLSSLPAAYEFMPGVVYQRLCWLLYQKDFDAIQDLFETGMTKHIFDEYPDIQARYRNLCVRHLYYEQKAKEAYDFYQAFPLRIGRTSDKWQKEGPTESITRFLEAIKKEGGKTFPVVVEGEFFRGWLALRHMNQPQLALDMFTVLYNQVTTPVSRAKMAYWAGRAARDLGQTDASSTWFVTASEQPQTYYGQLALKELNRPLNWAFTPPTYGTPTSQEQELLDAARILPGDNYYRPFKESLLTHLARTKTSSIGDLLVDYSRAIGLPHLTVLVARTAGLKTPITIAAAYPTVPLPTGSDRLPHIQPAFVYALIRQESMFDPRAVSSQGARGLMQMMPKVWRQWLKKIGLGKKKDEDLFDPHHNLEAGLAHLSEDMEKFEGNRILVLAAYNAGPHRAYDWIEKCGDPRDKTIDIIDWIEMIPYEETRGYIQRVLEAVPLYEVRVNE